MATTVSKFDKFQDWKRTAQSEDDQSKKTLAGVWYPEKKKGRKKKEKKKRKKRKTSEMALKTSQESVKFTKSLRGECPETKDRPKDPSNTFNLKRPFKIRKD